MGLKENIKKYRLACDLTLDDVAKVVGTTRQTIQKYESGVISNIPSDRIEALAELFKCEPGQLMGWDKRSKSIPSGAIPFTKGTLVPIYGSVRAGAPCLAVDCIEGYAFADVNDDESYFYLRVVGDSMINAFIFENDLVLVEKQSVAENGQIVVCQVNGDEATIKRYRRQGNTVILQPENPAYEPIIVPIRDFEVGYARIIGVVREVKRKI
jgi:repressor LexA